MIETGQLIKQDLSTIGTKGYSRFLVSVFRTKSLLNVSLIGLEQTLKHHEEILEKIEKEVNGEIYTPKKVKDELTFTLEFDEEEVRIINKIMEKSQKEHILLDKYIYSILVVFVWGTFETYLNQSFAEILRKKPNMLKTESNSFTSCEILDNIEDPLSLLINKEINKVGHFKLKDWASYLNKMINFQFDKDLYDALSGIYLVRNIVAHNTGIVRNEQLQDIPKELEVIEGELVLSKEYLNSSIDFIQKAVSQIEKLIIKKFFKK